MSIKLKNQSIRDAITVMPLVMQAPFDSVNCYTSLKGDGTAYETRDYQYTRIPEIVGNKVKFNEACYARLMNKDNIHVGRTLLIRTNKIDDQGYIDAVNWLLEMHPEYLLKGHDKADKGYIILPEWVDHNPNDFARFLIILRNLSEKEDWRSVKFFRDQGFSKEISINLSMIFSFRNGKISFTTSGHRAFQPYSRNGGGWLNLSECNWPRMKHRFLTGGFTRNNPVEHPNAGYRWGNDGNDYTELNVPGDENTIGKLFKEIMVSETQGWTTYKYIPANHFVEIMKKELAQ